MKKLRGFPTALAIAFVTACSDQPPRLTEPAVKSISGKEDVGQALGTAQARLDRKDTPWNQMSDESLRAEIERAGGRVLIGLKAPEAREGVDNSGRILFPMAAPHVAAAAALVKARYPTWTNVQVRNRLTSTALPLGPASQFGAGLLQAWAAVQ